jgi:sugar phosphate isomerase/epimerase
MSHEVRIELGLDGAFATRRWESPENVIRIVSELGFKVHEYCCDQIDPFFMGPKEFTLGLAARAKAAAAQHGVEIFDTYTGMSTHRYHSFSHSLPEPRERMKQWIIEIMDLTLALGSRRWGGHVDALPVEVMDDPEETQKRIARAYATWRELAVIAKEKGMAALSVEQMYVPSEVPWTLRQAEEMLIACNLDREGVPVYLTLDVGHQAGQQYGLSGPDLDYLEWTRQFGAFAEIVHLQQTTPESSAHWPFTEEYIAKGKVEMDKMMEAIHYAHEHWESSPVSAAVPAVQEQRLILEVIPASTKSEDILLRELAESADYLRRFVPEEGISLTV